MVRTPNRIFEYRALADDVPLQRVGVQHLFRSPIGLCPTIVLMEIVQPRGSLNPLLCGHDVLPVSWVFQAPSRNPDEQFDAFFIILEQYLLPTSPDEVNIESKMSKRMASFKTRYYSGQLDVNRRARDFLETPSQLAPEYDGPYCSSRRCAYPMAGKPANPQDSSSTLNSVMWLNCIDEHTLQQQIALILHAPARSWWAIYPRARLCPDEIPTDVSI